MSQHNTLYRIDCFLSDGFIEVRKTLPKRWKTFRGVMRAYTDVYRLNQRSLIVRESPS